MYVWCICFCISDIIFTLCNPHSPAISVWDLCLILETCERKWEAIGSFSSYLGGEVRRRFAAVSGGRGGRAWSFRDLGLPSASSGINHLRGTSHQVLERGRFLSTGDFHPGIFNNLAAQYLARKSQNIMLITSRQMLYYQFINSVTWVGYDPKVNRRLALCEQSRWTEE